MLRKGAYDMMGGDDDDEDAVAFTDESIETILANRTRKMLVDSSGNATFVDNPNSKVRVSSYLLARAHTYNCTHIPTPTPTIYM